MGGQCCCCLRRGHATVDQVKSRKQSLKSGEGRKIVAEEEFDTFSWAATSAEDGGGRDDISSDSDFGSECLSIANWSTDDDDDGGRTTFTEGQTPEDIIRSLSPEERPYLQSRLGCYRDSVCGGGGGGGGGRDTSSGNHGDVCAAEADGDDANRLIYWKKGDKLGKGQFGTVWCGLTCTGELIAVKELVLCMNDLDAAETEYNKIYEEVALLRSLDHVNIVRYIGSSFYDGTISIFMQFVPGGSLQNLIARFGPLEERVASSYTKQILEALRYIHSKDIIHRDVKCANVVLMPEGIVKLIDFGCAKQISRKLLSAEGRSARGHKRASKMMQTKRKISTRESQNRRYSKHGRQRHSRRLQTSLRGTPYWMSPEVVNETGHDKAADIWSLGCSVMEMLTGKPPWSDRDPVAAMYAIGQGEETPSLPSTCSVSAKMFASACLTRDMEERPTAARLLLHSFVQTCHAPIRRAHSVM